MRLDNILRVLVSIGVFTSGVPHFLIQKSSLAGIRSDPLSCMAGLPQLLFFLRKKACLGQAVPWQERVSHEHLGDGGTHGPDIDRSPDTTDIFFSPKI